MPFGPAPFGSDREPSEKVRDAMTMEPWSFCSRYGGEMGETENFWYVCLESPDEQFIWRKETSEFEGYHEGSNFSPDFLETMEKNKRRIEIGIKSGELLPNVDQVSKMTAEEFAAENNTTVKRGPQGSRAVCVDDIVYIWSPDNKFMGMQMMMVLPDEGVDMEELDADSLPPSFSEMTDKMPNYHDEDNEDEIPAGDLPSDEVIDFIRRAMLNTTGILLNREEAINFYFYIQKEGGDLDSTPPPPGFFGGY